MTTTCPVAHGIDPLEPTMLVDPYPVLNRLRQEGPVFYLPELDHYVVTRYEDIEGILLDRDTWSAANASSPLMPICPAAQDVLATDFRRLGGGRWLRAVPHFGVSPLKGPAVIAKVVAVGSRAQPLFFLGDLMSSSFGAARQTSLAFTYGAGLDYPLWRILAVRLQYRGLIYKQPDFQLPTLFFTGAKGHMAEPSLGIVIRF